MADEIAIKVENVSKTFKLPHEKKGTIKSAVVGVFRKNTYEKQNALKNVSFEVKKGEFFGIVGRNGSGKSTLLKLMAEIYTPSNGTILTKGTLTPFIELGVGFNQELTGRENVFLNGALLGFSHKDMEELYMDIVEFAELERFMDQKLKNYSSGMQVRLAFSIAIRVKTDILILDEVLAVGDSAFQSKCRDYFQTIKNSNLTVVLVTHDMKAVTDFCDRAALIDGGKLKLVDSPLVIAEAYGEVNRHMSNDFETDLVAPRDHIEAEAKLRNISILDPDKHIRKRYFKSGEKIEISVEYELNDTINNAIIDIGIKQGKEGQYFFYTDTQSDSTKISGKKGDTIKVSCVTTNVFNAYTFYVSTSMYNLENLHVYARDRDVVNFQTEPLSSSAVISIKHKLKVRLT